MSHYSVRPHREAGVVASRRVSLWVIAALVVPVSGCFREFMVARPTLDAAAHLVAVSGTAADLAVRAIPIDGKGDGRPVRLRYTALTLIPDPRSDTLPGYVRVRAPNSRKTRTIGLALIASGLVDLVGVGATAAVFPLDLTASPTLGFTSLHLLIFGGIYTHKGSVQPSEVPDDEKGIRFVDDPISDAPR